MTLCYAHLSPAHLRGAVDRLDGLTTAPEPASKAETVAQGMAQSAKIIADRAVRA